MFAHIFPMFIFMVLAGLLSTMNVYVDRLADIHWSLNDLYMTLLMTGWMFFFMGLYAADFKTGLFGLVLIVFNFGFIRSQFGINQPQYFAGMIPHHSMAVFLSKKQLEKASLSPPLSPPLSPLNEESLRRRRRINDFLKNIIITQSQEIQFMDRVL